MADRYWVGGTGTWDSSNTNNWSTSSGGTAGASVPNSSDTARIDNLSGFSTSIITLAVTPQVLRFFTLNYAGTFAFGTNKIQITGSGQSVYLGSAVGSFNFTGTPLLELIYAGSSGTRTVAPNTAVLGRIPSVNVTAGSDTFALTSTQGLIDLNFTGFRGTWSPSTNTNTFYGNLTLTSSMTINGSTGTWSLLGTTGTTQVITSGGRSLNPITQAGIGGIVQLADDLALINSGTYNLASGTLNLNNFQLRPGIFQSTTSNTRSILFGTSGSIRTTWPGTASAVFDMQVATNFTYTGTPTIYPFAATQTVIRVGDTGGTEANALNFIINVSNGGFIVGGTNGKLKNLTFTSSFVTTWIQTSNTITFYGSLTLNTSMSTSFVSANTLIFASASSTQTISSAGKILGTIVVSSNAQTVQLQNDLNLSTSGRLIISSGTFDANNYNLNLARVAFTSTTTKVINMGSGTWTLVTSGTVWTGTTGNGATTVNPSTSIIITSNSGAKTFSSTGLTYYNLINTGTGVLTIAGGNTFNNLAALPGCALTFSSNSITTSNTFTLLGTSSLPITITSTSTQAFTLVKRGGCIVDMQYVNISKCTASPVTNTWYAGNSTDSGSNSGITFSSAPTLLNLL
jgi:hypothetical protein